MPKFLPKQNTAFTIVEILIVTTLIGILASIIAVATNKVKQTAQRAVCSSNLRQLASAVHLYIGDNNGEFPHYLKRTDQGTEWFFGLESTEWTAGESNRSLDLNKGPLAPYLDASTGITRDPGFQYQSSSWKPKFNQPSWGYGYNWRLGGGYGGLPKRITSVKNPSEVILFGDCAQVNTFQAPASPKNPMLEEFYIINESFKTIHFRHNGKANILFVDGHVEVFSPYPGTTDTRVGGNILGRITPANSLQYLE